MPACAQILIGIVMLRWEIAQVLHILQTTSLNYWFYISKQIVMCLGRNTQDRVILTIIGLSL